MTSGDKKRSCLEDGQWSGPQPICTIVDCGKLPQITNGVVSTTGSTYGENATNTCDTGFDISNDSLATRTCKADGTWSGEQPVCNIKDCGHLPQISNGTLSLTGTTYGNTAAYACTRGFDINGKTMRTLTCQADGNWSRKTPVCSAVAPESLSAITLTGCAISIACLIITILLHVSYWRYLKGDRNVLAMAVCGSLLVAYFLFVFGINRTSVKGLCTTIAVLLHYTYLLVFFLMLSEGIYMTLQVVFLFHKKAHLRELLIGSFAIPAVIVLIVASVTKLDGYGNEKDCWLMVNSVSFWMFAGPALAVMLFNLSIILLIMKKLYGTQRIEDMNQREKAKTLASKMLVLLPVMGVTWIFGILAVNENSVLLQYLFVIFNSLQGLFIFLFHCVLNKQMRAAIAKTRGKVSDLSEEKSRSDSHTYQSSTSFTTHTHVDLPSTTPKDDCKTSSRVSKGGHDLDSITKIAPHKDVIQKNPPPAVTEEEKQQFKDRHGLSAGRLRNMVAAVASRASKVVSSAKQSTVAFTRRSNEYSFQREKSEDQIHIIIRNVEDHNNEGTVKPEKNSDETADGRGLVAEEIGIAKSKVDTDKE